METLAQFKICTVCKTKLPATTEFFHKSKDVDGLHDRCKVCRSVQRKKHYAENKEKILKQSKNYYANNKVAHSKRTASWRARNKERMITLTAEWRQKHPERKAIHKAMRRAREAKAESMLIFR